MTGLLIIATIVAIVYPAYATYKIGGIPNSLTDTYSEFGGLYQYALVLMSLCVLPIWVCTSHWYTIPMALTPCIGLVMAAYKQEGKYHYNVVIASCISAILWQICEDGWIGLAVFGVLFVAMSLLKGKTYFWGELAVIYSTLLNLWIAL